MAEALTEAAEAAQVEVAQMRRIGVGSPGRVDAKAGKVSRAGNLTDWDGSFPLA